jgi:ketosteroid isomerase-like protein
MTTGFQCAADARCWHPAPSANGICAQHHRQARLAQMRHSPSAAVRAAVWLLTQLHQGDPETDGSEFRRQEKSRAAAREAEPG